MIGVENRNVETARFELETMRFADLRKRFCDMGKEKEEVAWDQGERRAFK